MELSTRFPPTLRLREGSDPSRFRDFDLQREETLLGRDPACDVVLNLASVSRRHARVVRRDDTYYLEDLGSMGGTSVNGVPVTEPVALKDGDRIEIAGCTFVFLFTTAYPRANSLGSAIIGVLDVSGRENHEQASVRSEEKLRALLEIGRNLVGTHDLSEVLSRTLDALFRVFPKAERGFVLLKDEGAVGLSLKSFKLRSGKTGRLTVSKTIFQHVMLHGKAVLSEDVLVDERFGGSLSVDEAQIRTMMCVPLSDHRNLPVGILQLDTRDRRSRFTADDLEVLAAVAGQVSVAVDNARLLEEAARERRRLEFLAQAGNVLASTLDLRTTLESVARLVVPQLADLCIIDLRVEDGSISRVAAAHADPAKQELVDQLRENYPPDPNTPHPAMRVLHTGQAEISNSIPDQLLESIAHDANHLALLRRLGFTSYMVVPLPARGGTWGVVSLIGTEPQRRYGPGDLALAEELGRRAGQAIDNSVLYQEAQEARRRAEEAGRSKDLFLAMLSHELRTPLTPILAVASARLEEAGDAEQLPEWEMIRRNVALEARLIDDLLDLSRIERGRLRLDFEVVDVHSTIRQAVETCRDELFIAGLDVRFGLVATAHHVEADQARLMQVVWNLIRNAAKFTPSGGSLTIRTRNEPGDDDGAEGRPALILEFEDTGMGIEPEVLPRIFDAFEQGQADLRSRSGGLGLGLAISRSLVEAHGGKLTAHSAGRGQGSTFRIELASTSPAPLELPPAPPPPLTRRPLRILVVEDNRDTLRYLALILTQRGYEVATAASLAEGREQASLREIDLLISDIELPDGTGLELMHELADREVPGIVMSGFGSEDDVRQSRAAGFAEHLTKPIDVGNLEKVIQRVAPAAS